MNILIEKSNMNKEIAKIAERKKYYDIAVSRNYYYLFQKILCFTNSIEQKERSEKYSGYHTEKINLFIDSIYNKIPFQYIQDLSEIHYLRKSRNISDYNNELIIKNFKEYKNKFKDKFEIILRILEENSIFEEGGN